MANFLLYWAAQRGLNVIFESVKDDVAYIFQSDTDDVQEIKYPRTRGPWPLEKDRKTLYIVDAGGKGVAREPLGVNAFTICLASPNEKHYGQFAKSPGVELLRMPPWEWEEVAAIAPFAAASMPDVAPANVLDTLKQRYYEVGGVLRTLFMSANKYKDKIAAMKEELKKLTQDQIDLIALKDQQWQKVPNDLFLLKPMPPHYNCRTCAVDLASKYLQRLLPGVLDVNKRRALLSALVATAPFKKEFGSYRGYLLEDAVELVLPKGGAFSIRNLADKKNPVKKLEIPQLRLAQVWDIKSTEKLFHDTYYLPTKSTQEHIDALFLLGDVLFLLQTTVSASREFPPLEDTQRKIGGFSPGLKSLVSDIFAKFESAQRPRQIRFVFVVDKSVFQSFRMEKPPAPTAIDNIPLTVEVLRV